MLPLAGVLASLALLGSLPDVARAATAAVPNANLTADLDQFDLPTNLCFQNKSIAAQYGWTDLDDYANSFRTIVLEAGTWQTNMIACYAFQILVSEILGFDIRMDTYGGSATSGPRLANNVTDVTLELWPTDTSSWYHQYVMVNRTVIDYGPMGYTGRIGWYIPTYMVEDYPEYIYEFWRFLDNPAAMQNFTRAGEGPQGTNSDGTPECTGIPNGCQNGTYYPAYYDEADSDFWSVFYHMDPETSEFLVERLIDGLRKSQM
ncbi:hypothetical protein HK101_009818 [Irineochytrium annulatum]|nr:hypothetical protein HK101_009818 [Irineochytrium annulatum]